MPYVLNLEFIIFHPFRVSCFVFRIFKYVSHISSNTCHRRELGGYIRPAVGNHFMHGTFGVPVSRVGSSFHRVADGFSLDARTVLSDADFHRFGPDPCVGA